MHTSISTLAIVLALSLVATDTALSQGQPPAGGRPQRARLRMTSPDFADGGAIPRPFTCYADGTTKSPALRWVNPPQSTQSFVLLLTGPENHRRGTHTVAFFWGRWNIPAAATQVSAGQPIGAEQPDGSRQLPSDDGILGYDPPCAPAGAGPIHYQFKLYALDRVLPLPSDATRDAVMQAMDGHIIGASVLYGTLERAPQP